MMARAEIKESGRLNTMIGPGTEIVGDLKIQGGIRVDGSVTGEIIAGGPITVGEKGEVEAPIIEASSAVIGGRVTGDVRAPEKILLESSAVVEGTLTTEVLIIEEGAQFSGSSDMSGGSGEN